MLSTLQGYGDPLIPTQRSRDEVLRRVQPTVSTYEAPKVKHAVVRQIEHALSGPRCISLVGCLIAAVASFFATLATETAAQVGLSQALLRSVGVLFFTAVALWLANLCIEGKKEAHDANPWFVVSLFVVVGALRPVVSAGVGLLAGSPFVLDPTRIGMAVFTTVTGLIVLAVVMDALDQSATAISRLQQHSDELLVLRRARRDRIAYIRASLATSVIDPVIDRLMQIRQELKSFVNGVRPATELDQLAEQVRDLSGNTARRAAHELASSRAEFSEFGTSAVVVHQSRWTAFKDAALVSPYYPRTMMVLVFLGYLLGSIRVYGPLGLAVGVVLAVTLGAMLWLSQSLVRSQSLSSRSEVVRYLTVLLTFVVASAVATITAMMFALAVRGSIPEMLSAGWAATFFVVVTMTVLISAGLSAIKSRQLMIENLSELAVELEHEVSSQQVVLDRLQQTLARQLHGDVQSRLSAIALRINWIGTAAADPKSDNEAALISQINTVGDEMDGLALQLDNLEITDDFEKIDVVIDELYNSWGQVLDLDIKVDRSILERLDDAAPASRTLTEFMREGITNAVKHGGAQSIIITFSADDSDWITVTVVDDGQGLNLTTTHGFGLASLDNDIDDLDISNNEQGGATLTGRVLVPQSVIASS